MLRNRRGATSLRWLRALLDHGIEVHGQIVVCPGVNDGAVLEDTLAGILDALPRARPVGLRPARREPLLARGGDAATHAEPRPRRSSTRSRGGRGASPPARPTARLRRRRVLPARRPAVPRGRRYEGFAAARERDRDGAGLRLVLRRATPGASAPGGFFRFRRRCPRRRLPGPAARRRPVTAGGSRGPTCRSGPSRSSPASTGPGPRPLLDGPGTPTSRWSRWTTRSSGATSPSPGSSPGPTSPGRWPGAGRRALPLPDVCLSEGRFLDGWPVDELPRAVEVVAERRAVVATALTGRR